MRRFAIRLYRHVGSIVDASLIAAPRQCNSEDEKKAIQGRPDPGELEG